MSSLEGPLTPLLSPSLPRATSRRPARSLERASTSPSAFRLYFGELSGVRRLTAKEELTAALEMRRLRRELWEALLEEPSLRPAVLAAATGALRRAASPSSCEEILHDEKRSSVDDWVDADRGLRAALAGSAAVRKRAEPGTRPRDRCDRALRALARARDRFVLANLGLVIAVARRYVRPGFGYLDAVQEGNAGLLEAVDRFDPRRGIRFSTYAVWWIRHNIGRALADRGTEIRLPAHLVERRLLLARAHSAFERAHGRSPSSLELAGCVGLSLRKVEHALAAGCERATAFDASTRSVGPIEVETLPAPECGEPGARIDDERISRSLQELLDRLPALERDVLLHRFGFRDARAMTLREIGELYGLSRERIRQIQNQALLTLRRHLRERDIDREIALGG